MERKLTSRALALLVGVGDRTMQRWESGEQHPWGRHARRLAKVLGVTVEALELGHDPEPDQPEQAKPE